MLALILFFNSCSDIEGDILIKGGAVYDGQNNPSVSADIVIKDDRITHIGEQLKCSACHIIDASNLQIAPGFIDLHAHLEPLPLTPSADNALQMGVTTALGGPDGSSPISLGQYLDSLQGIGMGINVAYLIGHNSIRAEVMNLESRVPTDAEQQTMNALAVRGMKEGAFGISTGLKYLPGAFTKTPEIVSISTAVSAEGGFYTSHLREEGLGLIEGVREAIQIAQEADIPVILTHHKAIGQPMWGASKQTLAMVDSANALDLEIWIDQYPYTASYTSISVLIPAWAMEGGRYDAFAKRIDDPSLRAKIKEGIVFNIMNDRGGGDLKRIQLAKFDWKPHLEGKTLYDWAIEEGLEPTPENGAELVIQAQLHRGANAIYHAIDEGDVKRILAHPRTMIASDGRITAFEEGFPHPRVHGTFPRVLGHYARDLKVVSIETAIYKMTGLPAKVMGLSDRGTITTGHYADLVIFDQNKILDKATFERPHQYPEGIHYVFVNGKMAINNGVLSKERFGKILRGPAYATQ